MSLTMAMNDGGGGEGGGGAGGDAQLLEEIHVLKVARWLLCLSACLLVWLARWRVGALVLA
eukprot:371741-Rhodomonas_salina.3